MLEFIQSIAIPIRWLHILSAAAWFGEVAVSPGALAEMHVAVSTVPRLAMLILTLIFVMMMVAGRGFPA